MTLVLESGGINPIEDFEHFCERVIGEGALIVVNTFVPHQIPRHLALLIGNGGERQNLGCIDDRGVEARVACFMEEDRVQNGAGSGIETEGNIGDSQGGVNAGILRVDRLDSGNGFNGIAPGFFLPRGNGESEAINDDVFDT